MNRKPKSSWKTSVFGTLAGLASIAPMVPGLPPQAYTAAAIVGAVSLVMLGKSARDNKVSSEDVGAHSQKIPILYKP